MNLERIRSYVKRRAHDSPTQQLDSLMQNKQRIGAVEFCPEQLPDFVFKFHPNKPSETEVFVLIQGVALDRKTGDLQITYNTGHSIEELRPELPPPGPLSKTGTAGIEIHIAPFSRRYGLEANLRVWTEHVMEQDAIDDK